MPAKRTKSSIQKLMKPKGPKPTPSISGKRGSSFNIAQMTRKKKGGSKVG